MGRNNRTDLRTIHKDLGFKTNKETLKRFSKKGKKLYKALYRKQAGILAPSMNWDEREIDKIGD